MENTLVIALHGFLGLPEDWNQWHLKNAPQAQIFTPSLWTHPTLNSSYSFEDWIQNFIDVVYQFKKQGLQLELWGYSMGGRLALNVLSQAQDLFSRSLIVSANPGIENEIELMDRYNRDLKWAHKFKTQDWKSLIDEWSSQSVLKESEEANNIWNRNEADFDREALAQAFENWSLSQQPNLWSFISQISIPVEYHVGELDSKYLDIANKIAILNSKIKVHIHRNEGHRLIFKKND